MGYFHPDYTGRSCTSKATGATGVIVSGPRWTDHPAERTVVVLWDANAKRDTMRLHALHLGPKIDPPFGGREYGA